MAFVWKKPVLTFYRDRNPPEREAFAAVKAKKLTVSKSEDGILRGRIEDFFPLVGNVDCISSKRIRVIGTSFAGLITLKKTWVKQGDA